jgi:coenzyme PQQ synthesis protein D (PqqD)
MSGSYRPTARSQDLIVEELADELLVYDRTTDTAHCLTSVAATVWRACDGATDLEGLAAAAAPHAGADDDPEALALRAVDELREKGLLTTDAESGASLSRRQLLRRMAGAGMAAVAAPLIVSAAAPTPADAATAPCTAKYGSCTATSQCCSGTCQSGHCFAGTCTPGGSKPGGSNCNAGNKGQCCSNTCGGGGGNFCAA